MFEALVVTLREGVEAALVVELQTILADLWREIEEDGVIPPGGGCCGGVAVEDLRAVEAKA